MSVSNHGGAQLAEAVRHAYAAGQDDYHLEPMVLTERGIPVGRIRDHDAVVFCCRRGEREIELTELFTADDFRAVERRKLKDLYFAILTLYHDKFKHLPVAFAPEHVVKPLAQVLTEAGSTGRQLFQRPAGGPERLRDISALGQQLRQQRCRVGGVPGGIQQRLRRRSQGLPRGRRILPG